MIQKTDSENWFQWFKKLILMIQKTDSNDSINWFKKLSPKADSKKLLQLLLALQKFIPKTDSKNCLQILLRNIACKHCCNAETTFQNCCKWFANIVKYYTLAVMDFSKSCLRKKYNDGGEIMVVFSNSCLQIDGILIRPFVIFSD